MEGRKQTGGQQLQGKEKLFSRHLDFGSQVEGNRVFSEKGLSSC
jgi:hypothetical protein